MLASCVQDAPQTRFEPPRAISVAILFARHTPFEARARDRQPPILRVETPELRQHQN